MGHAIRGAALLGVLSVVSALGGCLGSGGAVNVRWRIGERETGRLDDPRDDSDSNGVCCQRYPELHRCTGGDVGWHIERVQLVFSDPVTLTPIDAAPRGLDTRCSARELTTPFDLPDGDYAITLRAYDPTDSSVDEAQSPLPELRTIRHAEIVQLDVVELSVSATQTL